MKNISLNRNQLKCIAVFAMTLDHIAYMFLPVAGIPYFICRFFGRLTMPIMAFFICEGYLHTKDVKKYCARLFLLFLVSVIPFSLISTEKVPINITNIGYLDNLSFFSHEGLTFSLYFKASGSLLTVNMKTNVIFTLLLGLLAIIIYDKKTWNSAVKALCIMALLALSVFGDGSFGAMILPPIFFIFRDDKKKQIISYYIVAVFLFFLGDGLNELYLIGLFAAPLFFGLFYNGEKGSSHPFFQYFFYVYYPVHMMIIYLLWVL